MDFGHRAGDEGRQRPGNETAIPLVAVEERRRPDRRPGFRGVPVLAGSIACLATHKHAVFQPPVPPAAADAVDGRVKGQRFRIGQFPRRNVPTGAVRVLRVRGPDAAHPPAAGAGEEEVILVRLVAVDVDRARLGVPALRPRLVGARRLDGSLRVALSHLSLPPQPGGTPAPPPPPPRPARPARPPGCRSGRGR